MTMKKAQEQPLTKRAQVWHAHHRSPWACGFDRSGATFCYRSAALVPMTEDAGGGSGDVVGDGFKFVDLKDPGYMRKESFEEAEVAARDAFDRSESSSVTEIIRGQGCVRGCGGSGISRGG
jgi:hypothetical protein